MGEAKRKRNNRVQFFLEHPLCIYCGDTATTTDHCPPRCFFERRDWPETYEFPACDACNQQERLDEQALSILARIKLSGDDKEPGRSEWRNLLRGVVNNQPEIVEEWRIVSGSRKKRFFREAFGPDGDGIRLAGFGTLNLGPLSRAAIERYAVKLAKALYYRHNDRIFEGDIYVNVIDSLQNNKDPEYIEAVVRLAPEFATLQRNKKSLTDQFIYRYNYSPQLGALYAVVQFGSQLVFQILAVSPKIALKLAGDNAAAGRETPTKHVFHCVLKRPLD